jgi:acyl carrier protein
MDRASIRELILQALAKCFDEDELADALEANPDDYQFEVDSKTAEFVLVDVEGVIGVPLPTPADLGPELCASVGSLIDAILVQVSDRAA